MPYGSNCGSKVEESEKFCRSCGSAGLSDEFAFDFTQDRDGKVSRDKAPIIDYIKQKGPFQVEGY